LGAGFFATGLAAAFDLLGLAVSFGMSILGKNAIAARPAAGMPPPARATDPTRH